jgi:iron complex outermembrane receptor protein
MNRRNPITPFRSSMSPLSRYVLGAACAVLSLPVVRVQGAANAPAPAPAANHPVILDAYVAAASPFGRNQVEVAQSTTVLGDRSLLMKQQPTLGETLAGEPGMSATSFGPGASRPLIRGLGGDRIRLLENSVGTLDASVASPDHAVSVEPFLIDRIEVVRGPASLLFGSTAVGGLVNVITHRIETEVPASRVRGGAEVRSGSGADEWARGGVLDLSLLPAGETALVLHLDAFRRQTGDLKIPGYALSATARTEAAVAARLAGEPAPAFARERLPNSALSSFGGAGGLSLVGKNYHLGASYSGFDTLYGVPAADPAEAGVHIDLKQRRVAVDGEWRREHGWLNAVRLKFGHANYRHQELEPDGAIGTVFKNHGFDARLELLHGVAKNWNGAVGVQRTQNRLSALGEEAFLPPSRTAGSALFAFEEISHGRLTWQFGARVDHMNLSAEGHPNRTENDVSGSLGAVWKLDDAYSVAWSAARTARAPNTQELFAHGPHAGTQAFEIGDASLAAERSLGLELSLRRQTGLVTGAITVFSNRFSGYINEQADGTEAFDAPAGWTLLTPAQGAAAGLADGLPVYRYGQRDAKFWGVEIETIWHLHAEGDTQWDLKLAADFTRARDDLGNLPRIPAARVIAGLNWSRGPWSAGLESQFVEDQNRVGPNEGVTPGYTVISADLAWTRPVGRYQYELFAHGTNLANAEIRPHPSFLKEFAPLGGRAISAGVRLRF